jgi:teichoic acid transport system permease protein
MNLSEYAISHGLKEIGVRPKFWSYLKQTWGRRHFIFTRALFSSESASSQTRLGRWWLVLTPSIQGLIYGLVFGLILGDLRPDKFVPFLVIGVFLFSFFSGSLSGGASSLTSNVGILSTLSFPRIALPLSVVLRQLIDFLPQLAILIPILLVFGEQISWSWLLVVPVILLLVFLNAGIAMIFARVASVLQDITNFIPFMIRILFYSSGIFFELDRILGNYPELLSVAQLNPVYVILKLARGVLLSDGQIPPDLWITASIWSLGTFAVGVVFFWRAEATYGKS